MKKIKNRRKIKVYFIDIAQNQGAYEYAKFFDKNFIGIALSKTQDKEINE